MGFLTVNRPQQMSERRGLSISPRIWIALAIALFSIIGYFSHSSYNPITEQKQHIAISKDQEVALGLQSTPVMARQYGGESRDPEKVSLVTSIGNELVSRSAASETQYKYNFHLLADDKTINAFALPGGQVFLTEGLFKHLQTRGQIAGVLAHEIGHVAARHSAQHLAKQQLTQGLTGAAVLATYDPTDPRSRGSAELAMLIGTVVNLKFNRADELQSDKLAVRFASEAGYDPRSMIKVMEILARESKSRTPEFFSTHPNPENRISMIKEAISERYPNGVPSGLVP